MRSHIRGLMALAGMMTAGIAVAQNGPIVRTTDGPVRGASEGGVVSFKRIPFAAPPVGPLRWRAPQPVTLWNAVRDATVYAADCMQRPFPSDAAPLGTSFLVSVRNEITLIPEPSKKQVWQAINRIESDGGLKGILPFDV